MGNGGSSAATAAAAPAAHKYYHRLEPGGGETAAATTAVGGRGVDKVQRYVKAMLSDAEYDAWALKNNEVAVIEWLRNVEGGQHVEVAPPRKRAGKGAATFLTERALEDYTRRVHAAAPCAGGLPRPTPHPSPLLPELPPPRSRVPAMPARPPPSPRQVFSEADWMLFSGTVPREDN